MKKSHLHIAASTMKAQMMTTFGPNSEVQNFSGFKQKEFTKSIVTKLEDNNSDEVEMTFGIIGSQMGNSILSNNSLRASQGNYLLTQTFRSSA
jgi:hypothetical protein